MTVFTTSISAGADDGRWSPTLFNTSGTTVIAGFFSAENFNFFLRFLNVTIPQGSLINTAKVTFRSTTVVGGSGTHLTIKGDKSAVNPTAPTTFTDANTRTKTTASVPWNAGPWAATTNYDSPELKTIIQEIVNQGSFASGNALQLFFMEAGTGSTDYINPEAYDNTGTAQPILTIDYSPADTTAPTVPTGVTAVQIAGPAAHLAWTPSTDANGVAGYTIRRGGAVIGTSPTNAYDDATVSTGQTYSYTVDAYDASNNFSAQSSPATSITISSGDVTAPTAPANLSLTKKSNSVDVSWSPSTDAVGVTQYKIYRNGSPLTTQAQQMVTTGGGSGGDGDPIVGGSDKWVSSTGSSSNNGTNASPWSLSYALTGAGGAITPGTVVWIKGGTYSVGSQMDHSTHGTEASPIIFIAEKGQRVNIRMTGTGYALVELKDSDYTYFYNIEFSGYGHSRETQRTSSSTETLCRTNAGTGVTQVGLKFRGCIFHDCIGMGPKSWESTRDDCEFNGCLSFFNGHTAQFDHGFYTHGTDGYEKVFRDNISHNNASLNFHAYDDDTQPINNLTLIGNVFFNQNSLYTDQDVNKRNILVGGNGTDTLHPKIENNFLYSLTKAENMRVGYGSRTVRDGSIRNNFSVGRTWVLDNPFSNMVISGNTLKTNNSASSTTASKLSGNGNTISSIPGSGTDIFVRAYNYNSQRANIIIYNYGSLGTVTVTNAMLQTAGVLIANGDTYKLINSENPFGDVTTATYNGTSIVIPMTGRTIATPVGGVATPPSAFPKFGAFQLWVTNHGGGTSGTNPADPQTYGDPTVTNGNQYTYYVTALDAANNESAPSVSQVVSYVTPSGSENAVGASQDDGRYSISDGVFETSPALNVMGYEASISRFTHTFLTFRNVTVPRGGTITSAKMTLRAMNAIASGKIVAINMSAEKAVNSAPPTSAADAASKPKTTAQVFWNNVHTVWAVGQDVDTPDVSTIVQEIVNQADWVSGNSITFFLTSDTTSTANAWIASYDHATDPEPLLSITYSSGIDQPPSAPTNLQATIISDSITRLNWTSSLDDLGAVSYNIYNNGVKVITGVTTTTADVTGLSPNTSYTFYVTATDAKPQEGNPSNAVIATTPGAFPVTAGGDDGRWYADGTGFNNSAGLLVVGWDSAVALHQYSFMRFQGITVPKNATINRAYITMWSRKSPAVAPLLHFKGVLEANPTAPTTGVDANARPLTVAGVNWEPISTTNWIYDQSNASPDLKTIIQELVNQGAWASGNAMLLYVRDTNAPTTTTNIWMISQNDTVYVEPRLTIEWTPPSGTDVTPPTIPTNVVARALSASSFRLTWDESTDNVGVDHYNIAFNGTYHSQTPQNSKDFTGLTPGASYTPSVSAVDAAGNASAYSSDAHVTLPAQGSTLENAAFSSQKFGATAISQLLIDQPVVYVTENEPFNLASRYFMVVRDYANQIVDVLVDWKIFNCHDEVNGIGTFQVQMLENTDEEDWSAVFQEDYLVELYRSVPGVGVDWYRLFAGQIHYSGYSMESNGTLTFIVKGTTLNGLVAGRDIGYTYATIRAYKNSLVEDAIFEYVWENCVEGSATVANGRESEGAIPNFVVSYQNLNTMIYYEGDNAFANLYETIRDMAISSDLVFSVDPDDAYRFVFSLRRSYLGSDRSMNGYNSATGLNARGLFPVEFSLENGNISSFDYVDDHLSEGNLCHVIGPGDGATKPIEVVEDEQSRSRTPYSLREISRSSNAEYKSQREEAGRNAIADAKAKRYMNVKPLQTEGCLFGLHYFYGDRVAVRFKDFASAILVYSYDLTLQNKEADLTITLNNQEKKSGEM